MNQPRPKFSLSVWLYLIVFFSMLSFLPLILTTTVDRATAAPGQWIVSIGWPLLIASLWAYAGRRCSSDLMSFNDSLLWITASMMTGWLFMSFVVVFPALLVAFAGSIVIAIYGEISRVPGYPQTQWRRMVSFYYRNRMRQR